MADHPNILIVGAGIVGASIAWHLVRAGARVTVLDAGEPGGVATRGSWAWLNASWGNPEPYFRLRVRSMDEWRRLEAEVQGLSVTWAGGLIWDVPRGELEAFADQHAAWGYDIRRVDGDDVREIEPRLAEPPDFALHCPGEGSVEPLAAAETLLAAASDMGAGIRGGTAVRALDYHAGRVTGVETDAGRIAADEVVVAAGAGTAGLAATAGAAVPLTTPPGLLAVATPCERVLNGLVMAPEMHVRQMADGRLIAGADFGGSDPGEDAGRTAADLVEALKRLLSGVDDIALDHHTLANRPTPIDGFPAVGRWPGLDGLYLAVMHSGMTLAPAVGRFVAAEITTGDRDDLLAPYGPERFVAA